jgi:hypothetical protein
LCYYYFIFISIWSNTTTSKNQRWEGAGASNGWLWSVFNDSWWYLHSEVDNIKCTHHWLISECIFIYSMTNEHDKTVNKLSAS